MSTQLKLRRGTTAQHSTFTGAEGEVTVDITKDTLVVHDGTTAGGKPVLTEVNPSYTGTLTGGTGVVNLGSGQVYKDASGNVGIGTSSPAVHAHISGTGSQQIRLQTTSTNGQTASFQVYAPNSDASANAYQIGCGITADNEWTVQDITSAQVVDKYIRGASGFRAFYTNGSERARIDSSGQMHTTNGAGVVAKAYDCRAWVNFNGTGTVAIRASGNVSSITDNAVGDYTINFTTAMPDANYTTIGMCSDLTYGSSTYLEGTTYSTTAVRLLTRSGYTASPATGDPTITCVSIFR